MDKSEETEIKLVASPTVFSRLLVHPFLNGTEREARLRSVYFDTVSGRLRNKDAVLRVRERPGTREQTLKTPSARGGPAARCEYNAPFEGDAPDPGLFPPPARAFLARAVGDCAIVQIAVSDIVRKQRLIRYGGSSIEVAFDEGWLHAGTRQAPVCELELELVDGTLADLFHLALELPLGADLSWSVRSKGERCHDLAFDLQPCAEKARPLRLTPHMATDRAFQVIARNCLRQLIANYPQVIATGDPDAVHQTRVSVRRLRAAMSVFAKVLVHEETPVIRAGLKAIADALGPARDLHVLIERLSAKDGAPPLHAKELGGHLAMRRDQALATARQTLSGTQFQRFLFGLAEWVETSPWITARAAHVAVPDAGRFARRDLRRRVRKIGRHAGHLASMDKDRRHNLRIAVKKLRYAWDFFRSVCHADGPQPRAAFASALERLQDSLGELNDIAVAAQAAPEWLAGEDPITSARLNAVLESWLDQRKRSEKRLLRKAEKALVRMAASANDLFQR